MIREVKSVANTLGKLLYSKSGLLVDSTLISFSLFLGASLSAVGWQPHQTLQVIHKHSYQYR